jgi:2-haloacid dehalogenase
MLQIFQRKMQTCLLLIMFQLSVAAQGVTAPKIKVVAFDAFPIFDPREIVKATEKAFPGQGSQVFELWRSRIFQYQWLRAMADQYEDFLSATEAGLVFATNQLDLELTEKKKNALIQEFLYLKMWPDAPAAINKLNKMGVDLVFLSNMTEEMLRNGLRRAGMEKEFKAVFSTDAVRSYKPSPKAYALAVEKLEVSKEEILFVAFAGWDVAGAKWYGYPTFWVNRTGATSEELGVQPDGSSRDLSGLMEYIAKRNLEP